MKILGIKRKFKLKIIGVTLIFIMIAPLLFPSLMLSINQAIATNRSKDSAVLTLIPYFLKSFQLSSNQEIPLDKDLGTFNVTIIPYVHGWLYGGYAYSNIFYDGKSTGPFFPPQDIPIEYTSRAGYVTIDTVVYPLHYPIHSVYTISDIMKATTFDELVFIWFWGPVGQVNHGIIFPPVCFAHDFKVYQKNDSIYQEVVKVNTSELFNVTFNLTNAKTEVFTGTWALYQQIGNGTPQIISSEPISIGKETRNKNIEINLTGVSIENNTRIEYFVRINSLKLFQESKHIAAYANVNKTKIFISNLKIEWNEKWESGTLNYNELFTIRVEVFNPSSEIITDLINITASLGSYPTYELYDDMIHFEPGITEFRVENQVVDWSKWQWFHFTGVILTDTNLDFTIHAYLKESDPKGLQVNPHMKISDGKIAHVNLLLENVIIREEVLRKLNDPVPDWVMLIVGLAFDIAGIIISLTPLAPIGIILAFIGLMLTYESAKMLLEESTLRGLLTLLDELLVILIQLGHDPPDFNYDQIIPIEIENLTLPDLPSEFNFLIEYINLMNNYSAYIKGISITTNRYIGACIDENITGKQIQSEVLQNYTRIANTILDRVIEIQDEALGMRYLWNNLNSELTKNNMSYEQFLTNLTDFEQLVKNETVRQAIYDNLTQQGYNETQIGEILNHTSNIRNITEHLISSEANRSTNILNITHEFKITNVDNIMRTNLEVDEIVELSKSVNISSSIETSQNLEASVRADIIIDPSSIQIKPGDTDQLFLRISNLQGKTEPFNISIQNIPQEWEINYQRQLNISGLTTEEIPISISIPKNSCEAPRVVTLRIIISNTVVDFNSTVLISVKPYHEVRVSVTPKTQDIRPEKSAIYTINIKNLANVNDTFNIVLEGQIPSSITQLETNKITLQPDESSSLKINATILQSWASMENQTCNFTLTVISSDQVTRNSSRFNLTVIATPKSMMLYVISEISTLQVEVNNTLNGTFKNIILCQLNKSIIHLNDSINEYEKGNYSKAIVLDKLAKINLLISEVLVWIGDCIGQIDDNFSKYLISNLHIIRNHIASVMGKIVDTTLSLEIDQIEIEIFDIADNIYDYTSVSLIDAILININLWKSTEWLDLGLIHLSEGDVGKAADCIQKAIYSLKQTKLMVSILNWLGSINDDDAQKINGLIQIQIDNLDNLIN